MDYKVLVRPRLRLLLNMLDKTVLGLPIGEYNGSVFASSDKASAIHSGKNGGEREEDNRESSKSAAIQRSS